MNRCSLFAFVLPLSLVACAAPPAGGASDPEETTGEAASALTLDFCATASPAITRSPSDITLDAGPDHEASGNAAYAYKGGCDRFVVDTRVGPNVKKYEGVLLSALPFDLPSSSSLGGTLPNNALDCSKLRLSVDFYAKTAGQASFGKLSSVAFVGAWVPAEARCDLARINGTTGWYEWVAKPPANGTDTIFRTAVKATLRGSAVQVGVGMAGYVAPPR